MKLFDYIEDAFQEFRNFNDSSKAFVTFLTLFGSILILLYTIRFLIALRKDLQLYLFNQLCCKTNFRQKYGKWAVVSGATDGIGLCMARELAKRGMSIIIIGRNEEKLARTKLSLDELTNEGEIITVKIDLADSSIENYERIQKQTDPDNRDIGILINNAGVFYSNFSRFYRFDMRELRDMVNVNVLAAIFLTRMILPGMVSRGRGLIMNTSSILGHHPSPLMAVYSPTKAFLNNFSEQLQIELINHPIDVVNLNAGPVHTKLFDPLLNISSTNCLIPTADDYAKSVINAISTPYKSLSGNLFHEWLLRSTYICQNHTLINIISQINLRFFARDVKLSPIPTKKKIIEI